MKRIVLLLFMCCALSSFTMADRIDASLTPVKHRAHHHEQRHAHRAAKHHAQHRHHASV